MMIIRISSLVFALVIGEVASAFAQEGPIIDMHFHGALSFDEQEVSPIEPWLEAFDRWGVERAVLTSFPPSACGLSAPRSRAADPLAMVSLRPPVWPDVAWVRGELEAGHIAMLGEVGTQLIGLYPNDPQMEPFFALAEEFDVPFALHMGPGPEWAVGDESIYEAFPDFEIRAGDPLRLEPVLRRHPHLRLYIMHAAWPMLDELLTILWHNPNVYVDLGHLQVAIPRTEYYDYLRRLFDAGYGDRIMYGSDVGLDDFGSGIRAILEADFLTEPQKRDILYNNAARFLRLDN